MSIGNLKDQGTKGNNYPYQLANLKLLGSISDNISDLNKTIGAESVGPMANDAFGRLRVSSPLTLFDSSHRYKDNGLWSTSNSSGTTYTFNANAGLIELNLDTTSGAEIIRETTKVFSYQPGKSLLIMNTFAMNTPKANVRQRVG